MALTFELAHFVVHDAHEEALLAERPEMVRALQEAFPDALAAWLTRQDDGSWLDVILWQSREAAEEAARRIDEVAEARSWFRHIAASRGLRHVEVVHEQLFGVDRRHGEGTSR
jgi:predicted transcriptional regulator